MKLNVLSSYNASFRQFTSNAKLVSLCGCLLSPGNDLSHEVFAYLPGLPRAAGPATSAHVELILLVLVGLFLLHLLLPVSPSMALCGRFTCDGLNHKTFPGLPCLVSLLCCSQSLGEGPKKLQLQYPVSLLGTCFPAGLATAFYCCPSSQAAVSF
jgi:hypothetical protein